MRRIFPDALLRYIPSVVFMVLNEVFSSHRFQF